MKTRRFGLSCESLLSGKLHGNIQSISLFTHVIHLSGTKSMPAQSWRCATTTYLLWRTITALWPSRSFLCLSAISLQTWIPRRSNRSDRWDMHVKLSLVSSCQAIWVLSHCYKVLSHISEVVKCKQMLCKHLWQFYSSIFRQLSPSSWPLTWPDMERY